MKKLFLSYTTRDAEVDQALLHQLAESLSSAYDLYIDLLHNDSNEKQERVIFELERADQVLILGSDSITKSGWAMYERARALELGIEILECRVPTDSSPLEILNSALGVLKQTDNRHVAQTVASGVC